MLIARAAVSRVTAAVPPLQGSVERVPIPWHNIGALGQLAGDRTGSTVPAVRGGRQGSSRRKALRRKIVGGPRRPAALARDRG